jgi:hypothetical protein
MRIGLLSQRYNPEGGATAAAAAFRRNAPPEIRELTAVTP